MSDLTQRAGASDGGVPLKRLLTYGEGREGEGSELSAVVIVCTHVIISLHDCNRLCLQAASSVICIFCIPLVSSIIRV